MSSMLKSHIRKIGNDCRLGRYTYPGQDMCTFHVAPMRAATAEKAPSTRRVCTRTHRMWTIVRTVCTCPNNAHQNRIWTNLLARGERAFELVLVEGKIWPRNRLGVHPPFNSLSNRNRIKQTIKYGKNYPKRSKTQVVVFDPPVIILSYLNRTKNTL